MHHCLISQGSTADARRPGCVLQKPVHSLGHIAATPAATVRSFLPTAPQSPPRQPSLAKSTISLLQTTFWGCSGFGPAPHPSRISAADRNPFDRPSSAQTRRSEPICESFVSIGTLECPLQFRIFTFELNLAQCLKPWAWRNGRNGAVASTASIDAPYNADYFPEARHRA